MAAQLIGKRIRALREERNLSQENVAEIFGFKDRQTVSAIETGARRVTAEELVLAVERLVPHWSTSPIRSCSLAKAAFPGARPASTPSCSKPTNAAPGAGSPLSGPWCRRSGARPR